MSRLVHSLVVVALITGCASPVPRTKSDIPPATQVAMSSLYVGMTEAEVLAVMKPVTTDIARITYGGTGRGLLYFQVSPTKQFWLAVGELPASKIERIGKVEA